MVGAGAASFFGVRQFTAGDSASASTGEDPELRKRFDYLSTHGNSNCSDAFKNSISRMADSDRLQGSCCAPLVFETYTDQIAGLKKYAAVAVIPPDPYDIEAAVAKKLLEYDRTLTPTPSEQAVLDKAVADSNEKGYCCCMCWRWYTYEGLSKHLVRNQGFTPAQITDVLNNSDGCGGES